jgi:hypothetical protein
MDYIARLLSGGTKQAAKESGREHAAWIEAAAATANEQEQQSGKGKAQRQDAEALQGNEADEEQAKAGPRVDTGGLSGCVGSIPFEQAQVRRPAESGAESCAEQFCQRWRVWPDERRSPAGHGEGQGEAKRDLIEAQGEVVSLAQTLREEEGGDYHCDEQGLDFDIHHGPL